MTQLAENERTQSSQTAGERIQNSIDPMGWGFEESSIGQNLKTWFCKVIDKNGRVLQEGMGKGLGAQSRTSARWEAMEHTLTDLTYRKEFVDYEFSRLHPHQVHETIKDAASSFSNQGRWIAQESLHTGKQFNFPVALTDPFSRYEDFFPEDSFYRNNKRKPEFFRHNNGIAIGSNKKEATLHALAELSERFCLATAYVDSYLKDHPKPLKKINISTLPEEQKSLYQQVLNECHFDQAVNGSLIDIKNELEIPCFAFKLELPDQPYPFIGYGCSLSASYAIERAMLEALQLYHVILHPNYKDQAISERNNELRSLSAMPKIKSAVLFEEINPEKLQAEEVKFRDTSFSQASIDQQISIYLKRFTAIGSEVYCSELLSDSFSEAHHTKLEGVSLVKLYAPELSNFSFIEAAFPVTPTGKILHRLISA